MNMFDMPLIELARLADELSASPDRSTFEERVVLHLGRLRAEAQAATTHLVVRWGVRPDQHLFIHGRSAHTDVPGLAEALDACESWRRLSTRPGFTAVDLGSAPTDVLNVMATRGLTTLWIVAGARSMPGSSHAVFGFGGEPPTPSSDAATALSIRCTLLVSRAISRLELFEWDALKSRSVSDDSSFLFETDVLGVLVRWPYPIDSDDRRLVSQIVAPDRRQVAEALDAILGGSTTSYELLVRRNTGRSSETMRLLARRSPNGGMEGIVLPPSLPVAVLPDDVAERLTTREQEIVRLLAAGYRVKQVSEQLYLSHNTVRNHLKNIFTKLDVSSQPALIALVNDPHSLRRPTAAV